MARLKYGLWNSRDNWKWVKKRDYKFVEWAFKNESKKTQFFVFVQMPLWGFWGPVSSFSPLSVSLGMQSFARIKKLIKHICIEEVTSKLKGPVSQDGLYPEKKSKLLKGTSYGIGISNLMKYNKKNKNGKNLKIFPWVTYKQF